MNALLAVAIGGMIVALVAGLLAKILLGISELCSKIARVIDRTPNRVLIPVCFTGPLWVVGFLALIAWLHG